MAFGFLVFVSCLCVSSIEITGKGFTVYQASTM